MGGAAAALLPGTVLWATEARSAATAERASAFTDAGTVEALVAQSDVILSICPPHAAQDVARQVADHAESNPR